MRVLSNAQPDLPVSIHEMLGGASWLISFGSPDPMLLNVLAAGSAPLLVVVPTDRQARQLLEAWGRECWPQRWQLQVQLVGAQADDCTLFFYNDSRFDGVVPLDELRHRFPNLQLEGMELRPQIDVNALVRAWEPAAVDGGILLLGASGGGLLAALLPELAIHLRGVLWQGGSPKSDLNAVLRRSSLVPLDDLEDEGLWVWRRDPALHLEQTLMVERDQLKVRVQELEQRLIAINTELDAVLALLDG